MHRLAAALIAASVLVAGTAHAQTQTFPSRPIKIVVPYTPGGASDITARVIADRLKGPLGVGVVVENKAGASGMIGTDAVAKAPPDGHTLALVASSHVVNKALFPTIPYDPLKDFVPVTLTAQVQLVAVVPAQLPVKSIGEFIAYAKAKPGQLAFASSGNGSNPHFFAAQLIEMAGLEMTHVPYRGSTAAHPDLLAMRTHLMFDAYAAVAGHVQAGGLRLLAVAGPQRSPLLPEVPTIAESGLPGYGATSWGGILAPAGTPDAVVRRLNREIVAILRDPEVKERLGGLGAEVVGSTPEEFGAFMAVEEARYGKLVTSLGIKGE